MLVVTRQIIEKMTRQQLIDFSWSLVCEMANLQSESLDHQEIREQTEGDSPRFGPLSGDERDKKDN